MTTEDKGKLFILFVPSFTLSLLSKIVCSLCTNQKFFLLSAERPRYKFIATVLRKICKQRLSQ